MMHEITGSMTVQIAAHYLENNQKGQGILLGGISGVPPATVVILGAGIIAEYAARTALGYGAQVFVMDTDLAQLRHLENSLDRRIITAMATHQFISSALKVADVVIGAATGRRPPLPLLGDPPHGPDHEGRQCYRGCGHRSGRMHRDQPHHLTLRSGLCGARRCTLLRA
jgi:alanine dehydrogenase